MAFAGQGIPYRAIHENPLQLKLPNFDYHTLRHTHATMLLEAGVNPVDIQERLGHSKLIMTWRYAHNTDVIRKSSMSIMDKLFSCP